MYIFLVYIESYGDVGDVGDAIVFGRLIAMDH